MKRNRRAQLIEMAKDYAAGWLATDCDRGDIDGLTEKEEEFVREYIRNKIVERIKR